MLRAVALLQLAKGVSAPRISAVVLFTEAAHRHETEWFVDPMPPVKRCAERGALSHRVIDAITEVCRTKNEYDLAKEKKPERVDALALGLHKARAAESAAIHALEEHTKQHGCRNKPGL